MESLDTLAGFRTMHEVREALSRFGTSKVVSRLFKQIEIAGLVQLGRNGITLV